MTAKTILAASSLLALAFASTQAFAGNAVPDVATAPTQQISPPTDAASSDAPNAKPHRKHRHHHKNARRHHRRQQHQPGNAPQQSGNPTPG